MRARSSKRPEGGVRIFDIPPFNFEATDSFELIDWQQCTVTDPPFLKPIGLPDCGTEGLVHSGETANIAFPRFPCHTEAVERCVKGVTEACKSVVGQEARDGFIRARSIARGIMPTFNTKSEYGTQ